MRFAQVGLARMAQFKEQEVEILDQDDKENVF